MNFQPTKSISSLQLISALSFTKTGTHIDANAQTQIIVLQRNTNTHSLSINPVIPLCLSRCTRVNHTPGELNAVNVCTNRPLIDKLFMLSSRRIHIKGETGGVAPHHHSKEASDMDAAVKVCLWCCSFPQKEKQIFFKALELAPG